MKLNVESVGSAGYEYVFTFFTKPRECKSSLF